MHSPSASSLFFALDIWTLRYEPLVSGSSCSLFGLYFPGAMLGPTMDTYLRLLWCSSWVGRRHVRCCATTGLWSDSGENCGFRSCIPLLSGRCPWFAGRADSRCKCGGDSRIPQLQLVVRVPGQGCWTCLRCAMPGAWSSVLKLRILRTCSSSTRCGTSPAIFAATCLSVGVLRRDSGTWLRCVIRVRIFLGHLCQSQVPGGAGVAREFTPR